MTEKIDTVVTEAQPLLLTCCFLTEASADLDRKLEIAKGV